MAKDKPDMVELRVVVNGDVVGTIPATRRDKSTKPFSSGKFGFYSTGKVSIGGSDHQLGCSIVEISK